MCGCLPMCAYACGGTHQGVCVEQVVGLHVCREPQTLECQSWKENTNHGHNSARSTFIFCLCTPHNNTVSGNPHLKGKETEAQRSHVFHPSHQLVSGRARI